tara:strand:- start:3882 stop:4283 length:402 start_codon:yes stop_codon:yes gene_type:complete
MDFHNAHTDIHNTMYNFNENLIRVVCTELGQHDKADALIEKYLTKTFIKIKAMRDPLKPKRPMSSYMLFCNDKREKVMEKNPALKLGDISKELGKLWGKLSANDRKPYIVKSEEEKELYDEAIVDWKTKKLIT